MTDDKKIGSFRSPQDALFVQPYNDLWEENDNNDNHSVNHKDINDDDKDNRFEEDRRFDDGGGGRYPEEIPKNTKKQKTGHDGCLTINHVTSDLTYDEDNNDFDKSDDDTEADGSDDDEN